MKHSKLFFVCLVLIGAVLSGSALADPWHGPRGPGGGDIGIEFMFGAPFFPFYPYPPPYPYYPPVVVAPQPPPVYVEKAPVLSDQQSSASSENYYWYHCDKPDGYYPYIKECPGGWQKVSPTPPSR